MKTIQNLFIAVAFLVTAAIFSCQKQTEADPVELSESMDLPFNEMDMPKEKLISWQPVGSKFDQTENGYIITPPEGWAYAGIDQNGNSFNVLNDLSKTVSCTCNNKSGKCKPFSASGPGGTISGCGGECTNCTMTQSAVLQDHQIDIYSGGYYAINAETKVLKNGESAPAVFDALFALKSFRVALDKFYSQAYDGRSIQFPLKGLDGTVAAPKGHSLIGITIMGRGLMVVVPDKYAVKTIGYTTSAKASCSCSSGTCELKDWRLLGTGAVWCDGDCTTCTLTTTDRTNIQNNYSVSIKSYHF